MSEPMTREQLEVDLAEARRLAQRHERDSLAQGIMATNAEGRANGWKRIALRLHDKGTCIACIEDSVDTENNPPTCGVMLAAAREAAAGPQAGRPVSHLPGCESQEPGGGYCLCDDARAHEAMVTRLRAESAEREVAALKARVEDQEAVRYGDLVGHHMHRLTVTALIDARRGLAITCEDCESETICEAFAPAAEEAKPDA